MRDPFFLAESARVTCARARVGNRPVINDRPDDTDGLKDTRLTGSQPCEIQVAADRAGLMDPAALGYVLTAVRISAAGFVYATFESP